MEAEPLRNPLGPFKPQEFVPVSPSLWAKVCAKSPVRISMESLLAGQKAKQTLSSGADVAAAAAQDGADDLALRVFTRSLGEFAAAHPASFSGAGPRLPEDLEDGGRAEIREAYRKFSLAGARFLTAFQPGGKVYPYLQKCTAEPGDLTSPDGAFAHELALTRLFIMSRYVFTQRLNEAANERGAPGALSETLRSKSDLAVQDISVCPGDAWKKFQEKFTYRPASDSGQKCADYADFKRAVDESFGALDQALATR
jgi:hypothetical protein